MKHLALIAVPLLLTACIPDVFSTKPEVNIDPDKVRESKEVSGEKAMTKLTTENPQAGETFTLYAPTQLTIRLDANPTTGIWWQDPVFDDAVVKLVSNDYIADPAPEGIVGSGGTTVMVFETVGKGSTDVTSDYSRGGGDVYGRLDIKIEVTE